MKKQIAKLTGIFSFMLLLGVFSFAFGQGTGVKTLTVADKTAPCSAGAGMKQCLLVSEGEPNKWEYFYNDIKGFRFQENYTQTIRVSVTERRNPPADASSLEYRLTKTLHSRRTNGQSARVALQSLQATNANQSATLGGTTWKLAEMNGNKPAFDRGTITFNESAKTYSAEVCNIMNGNYSLYAGNRIRFSQNAITNRGCEQVYVLMEAGFKQNLGLVERYDFSGGYLNMSNGNKVIMRFKPENETVIGNVGAAVENTKWALMELNSISIKPEASIPYLYFDAKTSVASGFAGCNSFSGKYTIAGNNIKMDRLAMTKRACLDNHLNSVETVLTDILQNNTRYEVQGSYLYLYDGNKIAAKFMPMQR